MTFQAVSPEQALGGPQREMCWGRAPASHQAALGPRPWGLLSLPSARPPALCWFSPAPCLSAPGARLLLLACANLKP